MNDTYLTIARSAQSKIVIRKSSFLGFAIPVANENQTQDIIRDFRKRFHDARHVCYAYILRAPSTNNLINSGSGLDNSADAQQSSTFRQQNTNAAPPMSYPAPQSATILKSSDGGEPTGTAGRPILGAIQSAGLENVMVVVVRYFGGILLGTPGLIAAYREAAQEALSAAGTINQTEQHCLKITFPYSQMNSVMQMLKQHSAKILSNQSGMQCELTVEAPPTIMADIVPRLQKLPSVTTSPVL